MARYYYLFKYYKDPETGLFWLRPGHGEELTNKAAAIKEARKKNKYMHGCRYAVATVAPSFNKAVDPSTLLYY